MTEPKLERGILTPIAALSIEQIEEGCNAALSNAVNLLEEADILRATGRCARAYFLAHIACEELGKLPILIAAAVSLRLGHEVDWRRIDRALRSHVGKIKQVLFMDSIVGGAGLADGTAAYKADIRRMRAYTDLKNLSLYSFPTEAGFASPSDAISCELFDSFRELAQGRRRAFESMYLVPVRAAGGLVPFLERMDSPRIQAAMETLTGPIGRRAVEAYRDTGDEEELRQLFDRLMTVP